MMYFVQRGLGLGLMRCILTISMRRRFEMKKRLFVLDDDTINDLKMLAEQEQKTMSALVREGVGLLKVRYNKLVVVNTEEKRQYIPKKVEEVV